MTDAVDGPWPLERLMSEVVGSGPKSAADMTAEQAREAFERILAGDPDPTTLGAFWLANRWKRNTPTELAAFVDVMHERSVEPAAAEGTIVDCGANYDGKGRTALLGVAAGLVAAAAGTPVAVHSGDRVPTQGACAYKHVLDELGVPTDVSPETSARMIDEAGFGFYYQPHCNPGVHGLIERRRRMGVRTFLNTIETLANPADASVHLGSFYHLSFAKKLAETVAESDHLGFDRAVFIQGLEGYDDIRPGHTTLGEWRDGSFTDQAVESESFGIELDEEDLAVEDVPRESAQLTREVIAGQRTDGMADVVALNAAIRLYAGGAAETIDDGFAQAREVVRTGDAADRLAILQRLAPEPATDARAR